MLEETLGFRTEAYLYEVKTKKFSNVHSIEGFLKELHFMYKKGKRTMVCKLTREQRDLLKKYNMDAEGIKQAIIKEAGAKNEA